MVYFFLWVMQDIYIYIYISSTGSPEAQEASFTFACSSSRRAWALGSHCSTVRTAEECSYSSVTNCSDLCIRVLGLSSTSTAKDQPFKGRQKKSQERVTRARARTFARSLARSHHPPAHPRTLSPKPEAAINPEARD